MAEDFTCDNCGQQFPKERMKEAVFQADKERDRQQLCPSCLDEAMNQGAEVQGIVGEEKKAAVRIDQPASG